MHGFLKPLRQQSPFSTRRGRPRRPSACCAVIEQLEARELLTDPITQVANDATAEAQSILNAFDSRINAIFAQYGTALTDQLAADVGNASSQILAARGGVSYFLDSYNWAAASFGYADPADPTLPTQTFGALEFSLRSDALLPWYWTGAVQYHNGTHSGQLPTTTLFPSTRTAPQLRTTLDIFDTSVSSWLFYQIQY